MHFEGLSRLGLLGITSFGDVVQKANTGQLINNVNFTTSITATPVVGTCTPDGQFIYDRTADGTVYARRLKVGEGCQGTSGANPTINQHNADGSTTVTDPYGNVTTIPPAVNQSSGLPGPITVIYDFDANADASSSDPAMIGKSLQVGPFVIPLGARRTTLHWHGQMPADWQSFIIPELAHDCSNCLFTSMEDATEGHVLGTLRDFFTNLPDKVNKDLVTRPAVYFPAPRVTNDPQSKVPTLKVSLPDQPIAVVSRPDRGDEQWGMYMVILPMDPSYPWDSSTNPYVLTFYWVKQPKGVWDWIKRIAGDIVDVLESVVKAACQLLPVASKTPNPYVLAGAVALQLSGECDAAPCPGGLVYDPVDKLCACPVGFTYDSVNKTCAPMISSSVLPSWAWIGLAVVGGFVLLTIYKEHNTPHKPVAPQTKKHELPAAT